LSQHATGILFPYPKATIWLLMDFWPAIPFTPTTEPRDLWPLVERLAKELSHFICDKYNSDEFGHTLDFWSTITAESFIDMTIEFLETQEDG